VLHTVALTLRLFQALVSTQGIFFNAQPQLWRIAAQAPIFARATDTNGTRLLVHARTTAICGAASGGIDSPG